MSDRERQLKEMADYWRKRALQVEEKLSKSGK